MGEVNRVCSWHVSIVKASLWCVFKLDVLFGNLPEMLEFQVEFLRTLEDGTRLVPDLEKLEQVDQFKVRKETHGSTRC